MSAHSDIELQILEHLRILRAEIAAMSGRIDGLERRLDALAAQRDKAHAEQTDG